MLIQLYVLRQLVLSVAFSIAGLSVIVLPTIAIQAVNKLGAISGGAVLHYLPLVVAQLAPQLLPLAFLLGVVATYGRLAADRELIAIEMAGIHPGLLSIPGFLLAAPLALLTDHLLGEVSPELRFQQRSQLVDAAVTRFKGSLKGRSVLSFGNNSLVGEFVGDGWRNPVLSLGDVQISASRADIDILGDELVIQLVDASVLTENGRFDNGSPTYRLALAELFPKTPRDRSKGKYLRISEMSAELQEGGLEPARVEEYRYEIHRRHAASATFFLFLLLGIPTGIVLRSSTQLGAFTGAVGYAFLYYVLDMRLAKVLAATGAVAPVIAAWATNAFFLLVGLVFFVRALWR